MNTRELIKHAKATVITPEMVDELKKRIDAFDEKCAAKEPTAEERKAFLERTYTL